MSYHYDRNLLNSLLLLLLIGVAIVSLLLINPHKTTTPLSFASARTIDVAHPTPSVSAKMICTKDTQAEIVNKIAVSAVSISIPSWDKANHIYSCDYNYQNGAKVLLSVKEMSNESETTNYFNNLSHKLGRVESLAVGGNDAFSTYNGSVVVRKDYKVLIIDVSDLPKLFGSPNDHGSAPSTRGNVAISIAVAILGCWSGE